MTVNWTLCPVPTNVAEGDTVTGEATRVTPARADFVESATLVAATVTDEEDGIVAGAM